jgi:hypothetical protein
MSNRLNANATRVIFSRERPMPAPDAPVTPAPLTVFASVNGHGQSVVIIQAATPSADDKPPTPARSQPL